MVFLLITLAPVGTTDHAVAIDVMCVNDDRELLLIDVVSSLVVCYFNHSKLMLFVRYI